MKFIYILFFSLLSMQTMQSAEADALIARGINRSFNITQGRIDVAKQALRKAHYDIASVCKGSFIGTSEDDYVRQILSGGRIVSDLKPIIESVRNYEKIYFQDPEQLRGNLAADLDFFRHSEVQKASAIIYKDAGENCLKTVVDLINLSSLFEDCMLCRTGFEVYKFKIARNFSETDSEALVSSIHKSRVKIFRELAVIESKKCVDPVKLKNFIHQCDRFITDQKLSEYISIMDPNDIILKKIISDRNRLYEIWLKHESREPLYKFAVSTHAKPSASKLLQAIPAYEDDVFLYEDLVRYKTGDAPVFVAIEHRLK